MLKANVGLSRKLSANFNSTGFSLNLEGEIDASLNDPEAVVERVTALYDLAQEALGQQIQRFQFDSATSGREVEEPPGPPHSRSNGHHAQDAVSSSQPRNGKPANSEPATNKQILYLLTLAKRQKLYGPKVEDFVEEAVGRRCSPYDLTKKEAGRVIDALNPETTANGRPQC